MLEPAEKVRLVTDDGVDKLAKKEATGSAVSPERVKTRRCRRWIFEEGLNETAGSERCNAKDVNPAALESILHTHGAGCSGHAS